MFFFSMLLFCFDGVEDRLVEWKLAGEDAVRVALGSTGGYTVVRPCALTEQPALGGDALALAQGDNMTGQVGRDDVARLLVDMLRLPVAGTTVEVAERAEARAGAAARTGDGSGGAPDIAALVPDESKARSFGAFPYVPQ